MMKILRRVDIGIVCAFCAAFALCSAPLFSPEAIAQTYPSKPIRIVVTSTPGSGQSCAMTGLR